MEIEGTVNKVLAPVKGTSARGEWTKQEVVLDLPGDFRKKVCISFWGDRAAEAASLKPGEAVTISIDVESREYNGRWFTEARGWKIVRKATEQPSFPADMPTPPIFEEDTPFKEEPDDLPF